MMRTAIADRAPECPSGDGPREHPKHPFISWAVSPWQLVRDSIIVEEP